MKKHYFKIVYVITFPLKILKIKSVVMRQEKRVTVMSMYVNHGNKNGVDCLTSV